MMMSLLLSEFRPILLRFVDDVQLAKVYEFHISKSQDSSDLFKSSSTSWSPGRNHKELPCCRCRLVST